MEGEAFLTDFEDGVAWAGAALCEHPIPAHVRRHPRPQLPSMSWTDSTSVACSPRPASFIMYCILHEPPPPVTNHQRPYIPSRVCIRNHRPVSSLFGRLHVRHLPLCVFKLILFQWLERLPIAMLHPSMCFLFFIYILSRKMNFKQLSKLSCCLENQHFTLFPAP
jgi:hypothetical protein